MKLPWILFALLVAMCLVLAWVWSTPAPPDAAGKVHPTYSTMMRGGDGEVRHREILQPAFLLGLLQICFFVGLLALGARHHEELGSIRASLLLGLLLFAATFTAMVQAYRVYAKANDPGLVLAFPAPSAWMLYGLWPVPIFFLALYVLRFDRWILSQRELDSFQQIVAAKREQEGREET